MGKKSHCRFYNNPPFVLNLIQINPLHTLPSYFIQIHLNIIFLSTPRYSKWLFLSGFPTKWFKCLGRPKLCVIFQNCSRWGVVRSSPNTEPGRAPLSAVRSCLFSMFSDTRCIWRPSPSPASLEGSMLWWRESTCRDVVLTVCYSKRWTEFQSRSAPHVVWLCSEVNNKIKDKTQESTANKMNEFNAKSDVTQSNCCTLTV